jgi:hypothetical protein
MIPFPLRSAFLEGPRAGLVNRKTAVYLPDGWHFATTGAAETVNG